LSDFECGDFEAERTGRCLNLAHLQYGTGSADIAHDRQPAKIGDNLAQKFETLASSIGLPDRQASNVAAWTRQARDDAGANRVHLRSEHDRGRPRAPLPRPRALAKSMPSNQRIVRGAHKSMSNRRSHDTVDHAPACARAVKVGSYQLEPRAFHRQPSLAPEFRECAIHGFVGQTEL